MSTITPYNAEIYLHKPWRPKGFLQIGSESDVYRRQILTTKVDPRTKILDIRL